jgi:hypothetical protein
MYDEESVAERPVVPMDNKRSGGVKESNRFSDSSSGDSHLRRKGHDADEARSRSSHSDPSINLEEQDYAHGDSKLVSCLRLIMLFVLVASAVGTALAVHHFTSKAEREAFDASFELDAANILESMGSALFLWLGTMDAYATHAVSAARATNQTWPFVSVPDGAVHMAKLRSLGKALIIHQTPLVTREQRADWERYTASNHQWAWDAVRVQPEDKNYQGATYDDVYSERSPTIGDFSGIAPYADQYLPTWQSSPFVPGKRGPTGALHWIIRKGALTRFSVL